MRAISGWAAGLGLGIAQLLSSCAWADVVVEGSARIIAGNLAEARELATRRALARAAESTRATVSAASLLKNDALLESIQVRSSACTGAVQQLSERLQDDELTVVLQVAVHDGPDCQPACKRAYNNRILVLGFALEHAEQKRTRERVPVSRMTAIELARKIRQHPLLLADFSETAFPYASPSRAPDLYQSSTEPEPLLTLLAKQHRAQYVLSGVYRDFGLAQWGWGKYGSRRIEIEAFIHDGVNGAVLAQKRFHAKASGTVGLEGEPSMGSARFYQTDLGRSWGALLDTIVAWTEQQAACLPFSARILKAEGKRYHIDAGAEAGLSMGDTLVIHGWTSPVTSLNGLNLGTEMKIQAEASIQAVYPRFSIIEISDMPPEANIQTGDVIFSM